MYKKIYRPKTRIECNFTEEGESIEERMVRLMNNDQEESVEGKPLIYGRPGEGVLPETDVRTDWALIAHRGSTEMEENWQSAKAKKRQENEEAEAKKAKEISENGDQAKTAE